MNPLRVTVLIDHPPRESLPVRESIDVVLAALALEQTVTVAFVGNGVYHCVPPDLPPGSDPSAPFGSLSLYDVDRLLVEEESLEIRGLADAELRFDVERIDRRRLGDHLRGEDFLL